MRSTSLRLPRPSGRRSRTSTSIALTLSRGHPKEILPLDEGGNARRLTLYDVIRRFEELSPTDAERRETGERTPAGRAIATVLTENDEIAQATFRSITIATMLRIMARQETAPPERRPRR